MVTDVRPYSSFDMTFTGGVGAMTFKVVEAKESRNLQDPYRIVYDVFADPASDVLFTKAVFTETQIVDNDLWSDEVIIGWTTWEKTAWSFYDKTLVKQWPPICTRVSNNSYRVVISFRPLCVINFETTPITVKRKSSYDVVTLDFDEAGTPSWYDIHEIEKPLQQAFHFINVDQKGKVQGVDVIEPSFSWTERWTWGPVKSLVIRDRKPIWNYIDTLSQLTATVNLDKFRGFDKGEVLFQGASGRYVGPMQWEIDYRFSRRPTKKDIEICGEIKPKPPGFEGAWCVEDFETSTRVELELTEGGRKYIVEKPELAKIHKVFKETIFKDLSVFGDIELGEARIWEDAELADAPPSLPPASIWDSPASAFVTTANPVS